MGNVSLDDIGGMVENLIEYTDKYFGGDIEAGIARLVGDAEDILIAQEETGWDDVYLRKICEEKYYDWKEDRAAGVVQAVAGHRCGGGCGGGGR